MGNSMYFSLSLRFLLITVATCDIGMLWCADQSPAKRPTRSKFFGPPSDSDSSDSEPENGNTEVNYDSAPESPTAGGSAFSLESPTQSPGQRRSVVHTPSSTLRNLGLTSPQGTPKRSPRRAAPARSPLEILLTSFQDEAFLSAPKIDRIRKATALIQDPTARTDAAKNIVSFVEHRLACDVDQAAPVADQEETRFSNFSPTEEALIKLARTLDPAVATPQVMNAQHIFHGDRQGDAITAGCHFVGKNESPEKIIRALGKHTPTGIMQIVLPGEKRKVSTIFPRSLSQEEVRQAILDATNPKYIIRQENQEEGKLITGALVQTSAGKIEVEVIQDASGSIITAYPIMPGSPAQASALKTSRLPSRGTRRKLDMPGDEGGRA